MDDIKTTKKNHKRKPVYVLLAQRAEFLKFCPICGKVPWHIKGTNIICCSHDGTPYENRKQYIRHLDARGCEIARQLFGI